jgi:hypothetical protein
VLTTQPLLVPRSRKSRAILLPSSGPSGLLRGSFTLTSNHPSTDLLYYKGDPWTGDWIPGRRKRASSQLISSDTHWSRHSFLLNGYRGLFPLGQSGQSVKLTIHTASSSKFKTESTMPPFPYTFMGCTRIVHTSHTL